MKRVILSAAALLMTVAVQAEVVESATLRFKLDENKQATMPKESVNGVDAKLATKCKLGEVEKDSEMGYVRKFNLQQNRMTSAEIVPNSEDGARTIAMWVNPSSTIYNAKQQKDVPQANVQLFSMGRKSEDNPEASSVLAGFIIKGESIRIRTGKGDNQFVGFKLEESIFDKWSHIAVTIAAGGSGKAIKAYVDGKEVPVGKFLGSKDDPEQDFNLELVETQLQFGLRMTGAMSEVVLFDKELSAAEVATLMTETKK